MQLINPQGCPGRFKRVESPPLDDLIKFGISEEDVLAGGSLVRRLAGNHFADTEEGKVVW